MLDYRYVVFPDFCEHPFQQRPRPVRRGFPKSFPDRADAGRFVSGGRKRSIQGTERILNPDERDAIKAIHFV